MTRRKRPEDLKVGKPAGFLLAIERHKFRERRLCRSKEYDQLMAEAKKEFAAAEQRHKDRKDKQNRAFSSEKRA